MATTWTRVPLPAIPPEMAKDFVAHSVTTATDPSAMTAPSFDWQALRGADMTGMTDCKPEIIELARAHFATACELVPSLLETVQRTDAITVLSCGTVIVTSSGDTRTPHFEGFAADRRTPDGIQHRIPIHRFVNSENDGKSRLFYAQQHYDAFVAAHDGPTNAHANRALAAVALIGYPNPGTDAADANVIALWRRKDPPQGVEPSKRGNDWLGFVRCAGFDATASFVGVLVSFKLKDMKRAPDLALTKAVADAGRDSFRYDIFDPRIVGVRLMSAAAADELVAPMAAATLGAPDPIA
jgi:hypothetical protein